MKITKLTIKNFLKLKDIEMNPSKTNIIIGKNKQGKTSILKAIQAVFDGKVDQSFIREGENKAEIIVELDDLNVKRTLTEKGNYLDISNKEGFKVPAPQKFLDGLLGTFSFNPIQFFELKPTERKKYLLNAIKITLTQDELAKYTGEKLGGIDYEKHALDVVEDARKYYYDKRTLANSEVTKKKKVLEDLKSKIPEGFDPKNVSEEQISKLREAIQKDEIETQRAGDHQKNISLLQKQETDIKSQIESLNIKLTEIQKEIVEALNVKFDFSDELTISAAKESLVKLESQREVVFTTKRADEVRSELDSSIKEADKLDLIIIRLTKEVPQALIAKAKLPVDGLTVSDSDILINGISLDNLSSSEQLRFALEVVHHLNDKFKVICIDGIETLDKENFELFLKEIELDDYQYFVTRVDGNVKDGIVIEDGEIKK